MVRKWLPITLIWLGVISIIIGILFKLFQIDLSQTFDLYPFQPRSFLNFAICVFLLSISISVLKEE